MGKSSLSLTSAAYKRQAQFYSTDQSRLEKNKLIVWDPFYDEDGVSLLDPLDSQDDDTVEDDESIGSTQLLFGSVVKVEIDNAKGKIRGVKAAQRGDKVSASKDHTKVRVQKGERQHNYRERRKSSSVSSKYNTTARAPRVEQKCYYSSKNDNARLATIKGKKVPSQLTTIMPLHNFTQLVEDLENKRASVKKKALLELVDTFERSVLQERLETMCITIFYRCLDSFTKGSAYESYLACRVVGLLAITVGTGNNSRELMQKSISKFSRAWEANSEFLKLSILDCLAITTFFGANEVDEVEKSMKIMWEIFHPTLFPKSGMLNKPTAALLAKAISAWSFLLGTIDSWRISLQMWKESFSFFYTLLEDDDCWVRIAAAEALAVIFETGRLDKFMRKGDVDSTDITGKIKTLVKQAEGTLRKDLNNMRDVLQPILKFLETGKYIEESIKISNACDPLMISTVAQSVQIKFFRRFLGWNGFLKHMQDNEVLHDVFNYEARIREHAVIKEKVKQNLPTLRAHKERLQLRTEHRMLVEDMHFGYGHFDINCEELQVHDA